MAEPLVDFRGKITVETDCVLRALSRAEGRDKSEIAREVLHTWAATRLQAHRVLDGLLRSEGLPGVAQGRAGSDER